MVYNYFWKEKRPPTEAYLQLEEQMEDHRPHSPPVWGVCSQGGPWLSPSPASPPPGGTYKGCFFSSLELFLR